MRLNIQRLALFIRGFTLPFKTEYFARVESFLVLHVSVRHEKIK